MPSHSDTPELVVQPRSLRADCLCWPWHNLHTRTHWHAGLAAVSPLPLDDPAYEWSLLVGGFLTSFYLRTADSPSSSSGADDMTSPGENPAAATSPLYAGAGTTSTGAADASSSSSSSSSSGGASGPSSNGTTTAAQVAAIALQAQAVSEAVAAARSRFDTSSMQLVLRTVTPTNGTFTHSRLTQEAVAAAAAASTSSGASAPVLVANNSAVVYLDAPGMWTLRLATAVDATEWALWINGQLLEAIDGEAPLFAALPGVLFQEQRCFKSNAARLGLCSGVPHALFNTFIPLNLLIERTCVGAPDGLGVCCTTCVCRILAHRLVPC